MMLMHRGGSGWDIDMSKDAVARLDGDLMYPLRRLVIYSTCISLCHLFNITYQLQHKIFMSNLVVHS
jgi:hypothetical protein